jgi:hypothetical protein
MSKIFVSYRRQDTAGITGRIYDRLKTHFGASVVFMDLANIPFGLDFREHIRQTIDKCGVMLAVIGRNWAGRSGKTRRIDDPRDFVRIEVELALQQNLPVIPVLIGRTPMPSEAELPKSLSPLAYLTALDIDQGRDFDHHVDRLIRGIEYLLERANSAKEWTNTDGVNPDFRRVQSKGRPAHREVPKLLHFHCNRTDQENQIEEALKRAGPGGPLICIVHGDEDQCHEKFLDRLRSHGLPRILSLEQDRVCVKEYPPVNFPSTLSDSAKFREQLLKNLSLRVLNRSADSLDEIARVVDRLSLPVMIQISLLTDEWIRGGRAAVTSLLEFWAEWPPIVSKYRPLVFVVVTYLFGADRRWFGWYRRLAWKQANAKLRDFLISHSRHYSPSQVVLLDELKGVTQNELEVWARDKDTQDFAVERDMITEVRELCRRPGLRGRDGRIAMAVVAEELKRLLSTGVAEWELR